MKKIELGQTITILANIGVIAGIVFLAVELRQNNELLAAEARSDLSSRRTGFIEMIVTSPDLADIIVKAASDEPLSAAEDLRFRQIGRRLFASFDSQFMEVEQGVVEQDTLPIRQWRSLFHGSSGPDYRLKEAWEIYRVETRPSFVTFIEENIIRPGPP